MTYMSGGLVSLDSVAAFRPGDVDNPPPPQSLLRLLWRDGGWLALAWLGGIALAALWTYAGMPMICH